MNGKACFLINTIFSYTPFLEFPVSSFIQQLFAERLFVRSCCARHREPGGGVGHVKHTVLARAELMVQLSLNLEFEPGLLLTLS